MMPPFIPWIVDAFWFAVYVVSAMIVFAATGAVMLGIVASMFHLLAGLFDRVMGGGNEKA